MSASWAAQVWDGCALVGGVVLEILCLGAVAWLLFFPGKRWRLRRIPGPFGWPVFGNMVSLAQRDMAGFVLDGSAKYGKVWKFWFGSIPWVVVDDADMARRILNKYINRPTLPTVWSGRELDIQDAILVWARGSTWRLGRKAFEHAVLSPPVLASYIQLTNACADKLVSRLEQAAASGADTNILKEVSKMTLAVVGTTAFGIDVHTLEAAPDSPEGRKGAALLEASTTMFSQGVPGNLSLWLYAALALEPLFEVVRALATLLPDPCLKRGLAARRLVSALCQDLIDAARARLPPSPSTSSGDSGDRGSKGGAASASGGKKSGKPAGTSGGRQGGSQRQQAPSSLLSAAGPSAGVADETDGVIVDRGFLTTLLTVHDKVDGSKLSDPRIIAQAMTFFLAGYETTANALAYTIYCVSRHPDVQDRLLQEIDAVTGGRARSGSGKAAGSGGGGGSSDLLPQSAVVEADLPLLVYTEAVIKEALRLYPPAISSQRQPAEDVVVGGLVIPAGTTLHLPLLNLHLNPEYWPQPLAFLPDRFMPGGEALGPRNPNAYLPFGSGPRMCVGYKFALQEAKLAVARLYQRFTFELLPGQVPLRTVTGITTSPSEGVHVRVHARRS